VGSLAGAAHLQNDNTGGLGQLNENYYFNLLMTPSRAVSHVLVNIMHRL
jgi:hypothetical protein